MILLLGRTFGVCCFSIFFTILIAMPSKPRKTVLIVEDDDVQLRRLVAEIRDFGYHVIPASNGMEGLDAFLQDEPDIVVSNIHMPVLNGFQLLRAIKRVSPTIPYILTTGFGHFRKFFPEKVAMADAFFEKPLDYGLLSDRIGELTKDSKKQL